MGTLEPTAHILHTALNVASHIQLQLAKKSQVFLPPARCAIATIQPTTKAALFTRISKTAAVSPSPRPTQTRNLNKISLLNALQHQPAHQLPIFNQAQVINLTPM